jgi:hypothetical protein
METNVMTLPMNSSCADIASRGSLEHSNGCWEDRPFLRSTRSALGGLILLAGVAYHFATKPLLLLDISTSQ